MGHWGVKLYEGDTACDVRDGWIKRVQQGASGEDATAELVQEWGDPCDEPLFWLALADTQWTWGRLESQVLARALETIATGGDLDVWSAPRERAARARIFEQLASRLKKNPPPPKAVRVTGDAVDWAPGQLWAYQGLEGRKLVFRVAAIDDSDPPSYGLAPSPLLELIDVAFEGDAPSAEALRQAPLRAARAGYDAGAGFEVLSIEHRASPMFQAGVKRRGELPRHRLKKLKVRAEPRSASADTKAIGVPWDAMDHFLATLFDAGSPRVGAVLSWSLAGNGPAFTVVEEVAWPDTLPAPQWRLGLLDCRGAGVDARAIEKARVLAPITLHGFPPAGLLREVAFRPPAPIPPVALAMQLIRQWSDLPGLLERPEQLAARHSAMATLMGAIAARRAATADSKAPAKAKAPAKTKTQPKTKPKPAPRPKR